MIPYSRRGRSAGVLLAVALSAALLGCSADVQTPPAQPTRATTRPSPGPVLDAEEQQTVDAAWAAFLKLNSIYVKAAQTGSYNWDADIAKRPMYPYAGGRYISLLERDLDYMAEKGFVRVGQPLVTLRRVVSVSATSIVVEACVDDAGSDTVNKKTRQSVAVPGQNQRYPVTLRAGLYPDGAWRWVESFTDRAASC